MNIYKRRVIIVFRIKKINAVKRNKIKRRIREIIRKNFSNNTDIKKIYIAEENIIKKKYKELEEYIKNYLTKRKK